MNDTFNCANIIKCVGTVSEINCNIYNENNNNILKGNLIINSDGNMLKFNIYIKEQTYNDGINPEYNKMINLLKNIKVGISGMIDGNLLSPATPQTKLFIVAKLNEYTKQITYVQESMVHDYIEIKLQGILYRHIDDSMFIVNITNKDYFQVIKLGIEANVLNQIKNVAKGQICDFKLYYDSGYECTDNVIYNIHKPQFIINDIVPTEYICSENRLKEINHEYKIIQRERSKRNEIN